MYADKEHTRKWEKDTIVNTYSTPKVMTALCGLPLYDRGLLNFNAPVSQYWLDFAQKGKKKMHVKYFFSHMSGLAGLEFLIVIINNFRNLFFIGRNFLVIYSDIYFNLQINGY